MVITKKFVYNSLIGEIHKGEEKIEGRLPENNQKTSQIMGSAEKSQNSLRKINEDGD